MELHAFHRRISMLNLMKIPLWNRLFGIERLGVTLLHMKIQINILIEQSAPRKTNHL